MYVCPLAFEVLNKQSISVAKNCDVLCRAIDPKCSPFDIKVMDFSHPSRHLSRLKILLRFPDSWYAVPHIGSSSSTHLPVPNW